MIRRLRYALSIVRDLSMILCPASASVRAGVVACRAADLLAEREAEMDVMEPWRFGPMTSTTTGNARNLRPAAGVAAGTGPEVVSAPPIAPTSGHPVEDLIEFHHVASITGDGIYCACHHRSRNFHGHAKHVAGFVLSMVEADARIAAATNKFHRS